ncbi:MAG: hypothetical protein VSS75_031895, partial [Candidatus Parabeggiatoa sp.]|nr:hypothetical protein [Candidatus Parabeggiatoa sp.]
KFVFVNAEISKAQQPGKSDKPYFRGTVPKRIKAIFQKQAFASVVRLLVIVTASLFISTLVKAEEPFPKVETAHKFVFLPKLTAGMMHYQYKLGAGSRTSEIDDPRNYSENLFFGGVGATLAYDNLFFLDAHILKTNTENVVEDNTFTTATDRTVFYTRDTGLRRSDYAIALSYAVKTDFKLFLGYNGSKTDYNWTDNERDDEGGNVGSALKNNEFRTKGPFIGGAYGWRLGGGVVGLSIAYAYLEGEIETSRFHSEGNSQKFTLKNRKRTEQVSSDTVGWKLGISWHQQINKELSYGVSLSGFRYNFEAKEGTFRDDLFSDNRTHEIINLDAYDVTETLFSLNASLRYRF